MSVNTTSDNLQSNKLVFSWMQQMITMNSEPSGLCTVRDVVHASSRLSAENHLDIYKGSYIARLRECMRNQFTALAWALGDVLFDAFTDDYLTVYPSHSYTLNNLGAHFAQYLQQTRPDKDETVKEDWPDFLIELAEFEFQLSVIFDEPCAYEPIVADDTVSETELMLSPLAHLFSHTYPVRRYYLDTVLKKEPPLPLPEPEQCVVTRVDFRLGLFEVNTGQFHFLSILKEGYSVADALTAFKLRWGYSDTDLEAVWPAWRSYFIQSGILLHRLQ